MLWIIALSLAGIVALHFVASYVLVRIIVFAKPDSRISPSEHPDLFTRLRIPVENRVVDCRYIQLSEDAPLVIIFHGQGETIAMWAKAQEFLAGQGIASFCFDYAGFGESSKKASLSTLYRNGAQVLARVDELFPARRAIFLVGFSLGAAILLGSLPRSSGAYNGIFLCEPFYSIREVATEPGRLPVFLKYLMIDAFNNGSKLSKLPRQVELFHSRDDKLVPIRHSLKLRQISPHNTMLHELSGFGHNDLWEKPEGGYWVPLVNRIKELVGD